MDERENKNEIKNEMEQIRRGLEAFLNSELEEMEAESHGLNENGVLKNGKIIYEGNSGANRDTEEGNSENAYFEEEYPEEDHEKENFGEGISKTEYPEIEAVDWDLAGRGPGAGTAVRRSSGKISPGGRTRRDSGQPRKNTADGVRPRERHTEDGTRSRGTDKMRYEEESSSIRQSRKQPAVKGNSGQNRGGEKVSERQKEEDEIMGKKKSDNKRNRKKKSGLKSALCKLLIAAVLIVSLLGFGLYQLVGLAYGKMNFREIASMADLPMKEDGVVNILLIGNDSRENGEDGRSDAMIILSISSRTKTIYMTSLLRDMYVEIPGHDGNRLNAAYSYGGAELLMETIKKNFDIPVNRYILVNFEAFANLVEAVDGIELELTSEEIEYVNGYLVEYNMLTNRPQGTDNMDTSVSGLVHLNGPQALAYSRNRYLGTDFGRTERQRKVLTAVIGKLPGALLTNGGGLLDGLMPNLTTNLTKQECFRLSLMAARLLTYDIVSDNIPQPGTYQNVYIRDMAVLQVDFDANIRYLKEKIYGE